MKNVKDQVYAALAEVFENVTDQYPTDWATLPAVKFLSKITRSMRELIRKRKPTSGTG